jgi:hypothetical protein
VILDLDWRDEFDFVSIGVKHYKEWICDKAKNAYGNGKSGSGFINFKAS